MKINKLGIRVCKSIKGYYYYKYYYDSNFIYSNINFKTRYINNSFFGIKLKLWDQ